MYIHKTTVRVRYGETDQMGYVYYGNYAYYYEVGRVEMLRSLGLSYAKFESDYFVFMPVMSMETRYIRPALYDDLLTLETRLAKLPDDTIRFRTDIYNEKGDLLNSGTVKLFFQDSRTLERVKVPHEIIDNLKQYFET